MKTKEEIEEKLQTLYNEFENMDTYSLRGMCTNEAIEILNWVLDNE